MDLDKIVKSIPLYLYGTTPKWYNMTLKYGVYFLAKSRIQNAPLQETMRQEHVSLQNVQVLQLYDLIKKYLQEIKLEIIH